MNRLANLIELKPGATVRCRDRRFLITHLLNLETLLAKEEETGTIERLLIKDITSPITESPNGRTEDNELILIKDEDWQEAERRFAVIRPLLGVAGRTKEIVTAQAQAAGVHTATLYRWIEIYESGSRRGSCRAIMFSTTTINSMVCSIRGASLKTGSPTSDANGIWRLRSFAEHTEISCYTVARIAVPRSTTS